VIILTDHYLATSYATVSPFDLSKVVIDRGSLLSQDQLNQPGNYRRYQITESGVSPRAIPLEGSALVVSDADEHNEEGHLIESAEIRAQMVSKRLRKLNGLRQEIAPPRVYGLPNAKTRLIGWGSTYGALKEAVHLLRQNGTDVSLLHLNELWPFPTSTMASLLEGAKKSIVVENNATGQLARLIRAETGIEVTNRILKFDGRPFTPDYLVRQLEGGIS
jgi:2-oxoglutarate ferredoxin oxidoreductase subunit alpha